MIVVFEKGFALRHIGHLDLMRTIQRALRRTTLPIRYSNGFNPHIQLSFAAPLSVGVVGMREVMDVPMTKNPVICVVGPTACGKTAYAIALAQAVHGCTSRFAAAAAEVVSRSGSTSRTAAVPRYNRTPSLREMSAGVMVRVRFKLGNMVNSLASSAL